jgi:cytochrome c-type biogenesis protein CcmH
MNIALRDFDRKEREGSQRTQRKSEGLEDGFLPLLSGRLHCSLLALLRALCEPWRSLRKILFVIISFVPPLLALPLLVIPIQANANEAAPLAADPALEARVMRVAEELRCLVCQNETIAGSQAELAVDLRQQIRNQLRQGRSEPQILDFMVQRYGEFVRYRPAFNPTTALLWIGPFVLLALAAFVLAKNIRRRSLDAPPAELDASEARRLAELLGTHAAAPQRP